MDRNPTTTYNEPGSQGAPTPGVKKPDPGLKLQRCMACGQIFVTPQELDQHVGKAHKPQAQPAGSMPKMGPKSGSPKKSATQPPRR